MVVSQRQCLFLYKRHNLEFTLNSLTIGIYKLKMIGTIVEDESQQGLGALCLNFYPHSQESLEKQLKTQPPINQKLFGEKHWLLFVHKQLEKLWQYDYDITYTHFAFKKGANNLRRYHRMTKVIYLCECGNKWQNLYQKVTFCYDFKSEHQYLQETFKHSYQITNLSNQSAEFGAQIASQMLPLLDKTIYPYLLRYSLTIDKKQCKECSKLAYPKVHKSKMKTLSKLFCRNICQILSNQQSPVRDWEVGGQKK